MARAQEALGGIDVLVNNAGIVAATRIWDLPEDEFRRMVDVNLTGTPTTSPAPPCSALLASERKPAIVNLFHRCAAGASGRLALRRVQGRGHQFHQGAGPRTGPARGARQLRRARHHRDGHDAGQIRRRKLGNRTQTRHSAATLRLARRGRPGHSLPGIGPVLVFHRHRGRRQWRLPHSLGAAMSTPDRMLSILDLFRDDTTAAFQEDVMEHLECSRATAYRYLKSRPKAGCWPHLGRRLRTGLAHHRAGPPPAPARSADASAAT